MDKRFWLDCVFATIFIFGIMWLFANISQFQIFDAFEPVGEALDDMEMTDIAFSRLREDPLPDTNIVMVNIGNAPRGVIARQIEILSQYDPKVIGVDIFFDQRKADTLQDIMLSTAIEEATKKTEVVMVTQLLQSDSLASVYSGNFVFDTLRQTHPFIKGNNVTEAFANLETEATTQEDFKTCRRFPPTRYTTDGQQHIAFSAKLAQIYNPEKAEKLIRRDKEWEVINYRGNVVDIFGSTNYPSMFYVLDVEDVLNENFTPGMIKDKIIILGFLGRYLGDNAWEDKLFTPLNKQYAGKTNPDMYGPVVHANAVAMILNEDYVSVLDDSEHVFGMALAVLFCFLNVVFFSIIYRRLPRWYDGITKLIQIVEILIILFIMVEVFAIFSFKLNLTITLIAIALCGDALEVFYGVVKNLFNKERRRHLFTIQRDRV